MDKKELKKAKEKIQEGIAKVSTELTLAKEKKNPRAIFALERTLDGLEKKLKALKSRD